MSKISILYIVSTLRPCGPINVLFDIVKYIDKEKFNISILTLSPENKDSRKKEFIYYGATIYSLGLKRIRLLFSFFLKKKINTFIKQIDPHIIHSHSLRADLFSVKYLNKFSLVSTVHNYAVEDYKMAYNKVLATYLSFKHLKAFRQIDYPVSISHSLSKILEKHKIKTTVIQNGIDNSIYTPLGNIKSIKKIKSELGFNNGYKLFVSVGRFSKRKDPKTIITAFMNSEIKDKSLLIFLGKGELLEECKKITQNNKNIIYKGLVDNVNEYLQVSDYLIAASLSEGFGLMITEALSTGLPCILSDIPPFREIISYGKSAAKFFKCRDSNTLTNIMEEFYYADNDFRREEAINIVSNHLNSKLMSEKYQDLYSKIYSNKSVNRKCNGK